MHWIVFLQGFIFTKEAMALSTAILKMRCWLSFAFQLLCQVGIGAVRFWVSCCPLTAASPRSARPTQVNYNSNSYFVFLVFLASGGTTNQLLNNTSFLGQNNIWIPICGLRLQSKPFNALRIIEAYENSIYGFLFGSREGNLPSSKHDLGLRGQQNTTQSKVANASHFGIWWWQVSPRKRNRKPAWKSASLVVAN